MFFYENKNEGRFERAPKTDYEQIQIHKYSNMKYIYIYSMIREVIFILDCLIHGYIRKSKQSTSRRISWQSCST